MLLQRNHYKNPTQHVGLVQSKNRHLVKNKFILSLVLLEIAHLVLLNNIHLPTSLVKKAKINLHVIPLLEMPVKNQLQGMLAVF